MALRALRLIAVLGMEIDMDVITFEVGDTTIQLVNGEVLFWTNGTDHEPDVVVPIDRLLAAMSTAHMLRKQDAYGCCA